jgi:hypothetical protein
MVGHGHSLNTFPSERRERGGESVLRRTCSLTEQGLTVYTDDRPDHLRYDDHVTEVGLDNSRLLAGVGVLLREAELLNEGHRLPLKSSGEPSAGTSVDKLHELGGVQVEESGELRGRGEKGWSVVSSRRSRLPSSPSSPSIPSSAMNCDPPQHHGR